MENALGESSRRLDTILMTLIKGEEQKAATRELELRYRTRGFLQDNVDAMKKTL